MRYAVLAVFCSLAFLTYLDRICIMRVQGEIERDLGFAELTAADEARLRSAELAGRPGARAKLERDRATERMSWVFASFLMGYLLFEVPGGWMGDRWGARRVITRIVIAWSIFTALTGAVPALGRAVASAPGPALLLGLMIAIRFLFGLGEAGAYPNIARALGRWFPFRQRASAQGAIWMASRMGGAAAPLIIGLLMSLAGHWTRAFWILGVVGAAWALAFACWFRDRPEEKRGVNEAERASIRDGGESHGSIYDDRSGSRLPWTALLMSRSLWALCLVSFSMSFCWYFFVTFLPKYLKEQHGIDYARSELVSGLPLLVGAAACFGGGRLSDFLCARLGARWGRSLPGVVGCVLASGCALMASRLQTPFACLALICLASACQDVSLPAMWSVPVDLGGRNAGTVGGVMNAMGCVGGMLSPLVAAKLSSAGSWSVVIQVFAGVYLLGALAWSLVDSRKTLAAETTSPQFSG
jgi:MFS family permease